LVTPTGKIKRATAKDYFKAEIKAMYDEVEALEKGGAAKPASAATATDKPKEGKAKGDGKAKTDTKKTEDKKPEEAKAKGGDKAKV